MEALKSTARAEAHAVAHPILDKIRSLIQLEGRAQNELAKRLGTSASHISHFLRGHGDVRSRMLVHLLEELGISLDQILENEIKRRVEALKDPEGFDAADLLRRLPAAERRAATQLLKRMADLSTGKHS